jgi:hypothetical protein
MINIILDIVSDFFQFLLAMIVNILSNIPHSSHAADTTDLRIIQLSHLKAQQSALLLHRDMLQRRINEIEASITQLTTPKSSASPTVQSPTPSPSQSTPMRRPRRQTSTTSSIGIPYPLPYTPPRTPEEQRRNYIIIWVNEMRSCNKW